MESVWNRDSGNLFERRYDGNRNYHSNAKRIQPINVMVSSTDASLPPTVIPNQYVADRILQFL